VQSLPHARPIGADVTVPMPVPVLAIVSVWDVSVKVAVTDLACVTETTHVAVPEHPAPVHPVKIDPVAGVAPSVTSVSYSKLAEQVGPQSTPAGVDVTVPAPLPAFVTASRCVLRVNIAVTIIGAETLTVHGPVPVQPPPDQPVNVEPVAAVAVNVSDPP
jgi:hypothetical protein